MVDSFIRKYITIFALLGFSSVANASGGAFVDRVLLKIDEHVFTQREMEIFLNVRSILNNEKSVLDKSNWNSKRVVFSEDMILWIKAIKLGRLRPRSGEIEKAFKKVAIGLKNNPESMKNLDRLSADERLIEKQIIMWLHVKAFRSYLKEEEKSKKSISRSMDKAIVRWFENSSKYEPLVKFKDNP